MAIPQKIINFLGKAKYEPIEHRTVYTAGDKAVTLRIKPNLIAKTVVLKIDKEIVLATIPGNRNLDKGKFKKAVNIWKKKRGERAIKSIDFLSERVMKNVFKGVKIGVIPPFGSLWKMGTAVETSLLKNPKIIINSGDYNWSLKISPNEFKKLVPDLVLGNFGKAKR